MINPEDLKQGCISRIVSFFGNCVQHQVLSNPASMTQGQQPQDPQDPAIFNQQKFSFDKKQLEFFSKSLESLMSRTLNEGLEFSFGTDLNCFLFGRDIGNTLHVFTPEISVKGASFFEAVLMSPGTATLIELIWEKMELSARSEILNMVRTTPNCKANVSKILPTEKLSREILTGIRSRFWRQ